MSMSYHSHRISLGVSRGHLVGTAAPADCDLVAQNCPLSPSAHLVIGSCIPRGCDLMGTHTRPICTVRRPAARQDVGDTTNRPRTHYKRPLNPEKTRQSHYPTPWAPSWVIFGAFAAKRFWVYFATGGATVAVGSVSRNHVAKRQEAAAPRKLRWLLSCRTQSL